jgi:signal peptidase
VYVQAPGFKRSACETDISRVSAHANNAYPLGPDEHHSWVATVAGNLAEDAPTPSSAPLRVAAIDIDGITTRLLVADVARDRAGHLAATAVRRRAAVTALEARPPAGQRFDQMAIARTIDVLAHFHQLAAASGARTTVVKAPASLQSSPEWSTMRYETEQRLGYTMQVAEMGSVASGWNVADLIGYASPHIGWLIDAGTNSADIVLSSGFEPVAHHRLTSGFLRALEAILEAQDPPQPSDMIRAYHELSESLSRRFTPAGAGGAIVGIACDLTGLSEWMQELPHIENDPSTTAIELDRVAREAISQSRQLRAQRHYAPETGLDTSGSTLASLVVLESAMRHFELEMVVTRRYDVLDQLAITAAQMTLGEPTTQFVQGRPALQLVPQLPEIETTDFTAPQQTVQLEVVPPVAPPPVQVAQMQPAVAPVQPAVAPVQPAAPQVAPDVVPTPEPAQRQRRSVMRILSRIAMRLVGVALLALLLLITGLTWGTHVTKYRTYVILGQSMEPTIHLGSVIIGEPVKRSTIKKGDVITYSRPDKPSERVTHRVVHVSKRDGRAVFKTKGDNNHSIDPWTADYVGKDAWRVKQTIPYVGYALLMLQSKLGRVIVIVIPALIVFSMFVRWLWSEDTPEDETPPAPAASAGPA